MDHCTTQVLLNVIIDQNYQIIILSEDEDSGLVGSSCISDEVDFSEKSTEDSRNLANLAHNESEPGAKTVKRVTFCEESKEVLKGTDSEQDQPENRQGNSIAGKSDSREQLLSDVAKDIQHILTTLKVTFHY